MQFGFFHNAESGTCKIETNVGVLPISYRREGTAVLAEMGQAVPQFRKERLDKSHLAGLLGIDASNVDESLVGDIPL